MSCDKLFCDIKCRREPKGQIPYIQGDKILFQTQFRDKVNPNPKIPIFGWGDWVYIEIWDASTMTLWSLVITLSGGIVWPSLIVSRKNLCELVAFEDSKQISVISNIKT
jgi:hypothetical protein